MSAKPPIRLSPSAMTRETANVAGGGPGKMFESRERGRGVTGLDTDTGPGVGTPPGTRPRSKIRGRPHRRAPSRATSTGGRPAAWRVSDEQEIEIGFAGWIDN